MPVYFWAYYPPLDRVEGLVGLLNRGLQNRKGKPFSEQRKSDGLVGLQGLRENLGHTAAQGQRETEGSHQEISTLATAAAESPSTTDLVVSWARRDNSARSSLSSEFVMLTRSTL
jgi:hypothetical protein